MSLIFRIVKVLLFDGPQSNTIGSSPSLNQPGTRLQLSQLIDHLDHTTTEILEMLTAFEASPCVGTRGTAYTTLHALLNNASRRTRR